MRFDLRLSLHTGTYGMWLGVTFVACLLLVACNRTPDDPSANPVPPTGPSHGVASAPQPTNTNAPPSSEKPAAEAEASGLWPSPTHGAACGLRYLPGGIPCLVVCRPSHLLSQDPQGLILRALGDAHASIWQEWVNRTGVNWADVSRLTVGFQPQDQGTPRPILVAELQGNWSPPSWWETAPEQTTGGLAYREHDGWCFHTKTRDQVTWLVLAKSPDIHDALENADVPPLLRRQMQHLLTGTDADRDLTVVMAPSFVFGDGRTLFAGNWEAVPELVHWLIGEDLQAISMSMHFEGFWYAELIVVPNIEVTTAQYALQLAQKSQTISARVEQHLRATKVPEYWQRIAERFPRMIAYVVSQIRLRPDRESLRANVSLPLSAAHNIVLASELSLQTLAQAPSAGELPTASGIGDIEALLADKLSFDVTQQSLEDVLQDLVQVVRAAHPRLPFEFQIVLQGADLQREGITRNQQIRNFHAANVPLRHILTQLVLRANPVTTVTSATQADQKLVWYLEKDTVAISTRMATTSRGNPLPQEFTGSNRPDPSDQ